MSDKPTYEELMAMCAALATENANLRRELESRGDVRSAEFCGMKVIVSDSTPAFVWNGKEISVLKVGDV
ncbi:hypothetical protein [Rhizobium leguminosarum]